MKYPRSPYEKVGGIVYFGRMLDKIRLLAAGDLPEDLTENLGKGFDLRCINFLRVSYPDLAAKVREGATDDEALNWCYSKGRRPSDEEIEIWNEFMRKRGWNDVGSDMVAQRKKESNLAHRDDIVTMFDYIVADEAQG
jgi:gluconokinase